MTLKVKVCPAARVSGKLKPFKVNPVPLKFACDTVTLVPPVFVRVAVWVLVLPACTLPKFTEVTAKAPGVTPVPESGMVNVGAGPLLVMARLTLLLPADWGANVTLNDVLCPALRVTGRLNPVMLYAAPAVACVRVILVLPELVNVSGRT